ncbi:hypothetical protein [Thermostaphylospora chromogena]|uniref:Phosphotransferase enzyme family protein n=1 Tax=Thermostaphylospora chromogena TaxID=35622 RepID=A0A1H1B9Z1_9ACTN|nr:hypothetical protein [Thermostaphylospora chromogena]SDQ48712.1 hypothetical protein SAMN04489764_0866 [Thermostaphylospora chromogena]
MMNDTRIRMEYLERTLRLLFPGAGPPQARSLLPHRALPRRLAQRRWWHRVLGAPVMVPTGGETIEDHLSAVFGLPVRVTLHVRPARRVNRKPVLTAHGPDGPLAYVKIGDSPRARELIRAEAATLRMLADTPLKHLHPPRLLYHGRWHGLEVLATAPLPMPRHRRRVPSELIRVAVTEIASLGEGEPYAWHGDFAPWNMACGADGRLLLWDWERFDTGVPFGFDAVHLFFQRALRRMRPPVAARACVAQALPTLAPYGLDAAQARLTACRYLIALADRHAADGHQPFGPPERWLTPVIDQQEAVW